MAHYHFELGINWNQIVAFTPIGGRLEIGFVDVTPGEPLKIAYPGNLQKQGEESPDDIEFLIFDTTCLKSGQPEFKEVKVLSFSTMIYDKQSDILVQPFHRPTTSLKSVGPKQTHSFGGGHPFPCWETHYGGQLLSSIANRRYSISVSVQASATTTDPNNPSILVPLCGLWTVDPEMIVGGWAGTVP